MERENALIRYYVSLYPRICLVRLRNSLDRTAAIEALTAPDWPSASRRSAAPLGAQASGEFANYRL